MSTRPSTLSRTIGDLADQTPANRDRFVDFIRALSIGVVVFGHWLVAVIYFENGSLTGDSALDLVPGLWALTWVLQVMPLFFFVGGFSNLRSWRAERSRGGSYSSFLGGRITRLMRPTLVFAVVSTTAALLVGSLFPEALSGMREGIRFLAAPLWFLAVYVLVVALAPLMIALHERFRGRVLVGLTVAAIAVDVVRIGADWRAFGYLNFGFVWLFAHQLGLFYGDGTLPSRGRRFHLAMAGGGLLALVALTASGIYSPSMVSMASDRASNTSPTSVCLIAMSVWLAGLAMWIRPSVSRWLQRRRVWAAVIAANSVIMTVFLWHLTALLLAVVVTYPLGFPQPQGGTTLWWMWRPIWLGTLCLFLAPLVALFGRYERSGLKGAPTRASGHSPWAVVGAIALLVVGLSRLAESGFDHAGTAGLGLDVVSEPVMSLAFIFGGYAALTRNGRSQRGG